MRTRLHAICDVVQLAAAAALGVLLGALLAEGGVLVPWWRSLPAGEFFTWYAANAQRLLGFFGPLTSLAVLLAVTSAGISWWAGHPGRVPAAIAAGLAILGAASYFVYFEQVNAGFAAATVAAGDLPAELGRWAAWHWARVAVGGVAFLAALIALRHGAGRFPA